MYTDRTLNCVDCGQEFTFTSGEQEFYAQRGFTEQPKRCAACRAAKKAQRSSGGSGASGYGNGGGEGYGRPSHSGDSGYGAGGGYSSGGSSGGYRERAPREMHAATCADCGKTAQVPFQPTGVRPVYCSDCFQTRR
ncbi:MAG: zinc-ribbon domain containing protein [Chloroflexi bacterium]|nr:zinc-ribbon domain containing protein [Chloroflexota bacterium]